VKHRETLEILRRHGRTVEAMLTILSALGSLLSFRVRSRASLELELIALRHQVIVLRRQHPRRLRFLSADRLLWIWLYRLRPQVLDALVLVKPSTVVKWHRQGFRIYWWWRSRCPGRPKTSREIRDLIRRMSLANPHWGAPRIHGELLKLGIEVSQATVGRHLPRRPKTPSPTWRSFLRNHRTDTAAIDTFVVTTVTFRILYALIVLDHDRRKVIHFGVTENPTEVWLSRQIISAFPWETAPGIFCGIETRLTAQASAIVLRGWASKRSLSRLDPRGRIRSSSDLLDRSVENVWTT